MAGTDFNATPIASDLVRTKLLVDSSRETFGSHPEDVINPINSAADVCGWLEEIFSTIKKESEFVGNTTRIKRLAEAGSYLAADMGNFFDCQHEEMFSHLKAVGIISAEVTR